MRGYHRLLLVVAIVAGLEIPIFYIVRPRSLTGLLSGFKATYTNTEETLRKIQPNRDQVFQSRKRHLLEACIQTGKPPPQQLSKSRITDRMVIELTHKILYCPAQKVASTFWMKTLSALESNGQIESPFKIHTSAQYIAKKVKELKRKNITLFKDSSFLKGGESLLVVRNPYAKLFSGYVDKLYHPNWLFWPQFGVTIKRVIRNVTSSNSSIVCGNDVTFAEYIKFILLQHDKGHRVNSHFATVSAQCNPCVTKYDYIIKLETFKDDVHYILDKWRQNFNVNIKFNDIEKESALDSAKTRIYTSFATKQRYTKRCNMSHFTFLLRTWRFLQITGLIPISVEIPFPDGPSAETVSPEQYIRAVQEVVAQRNTTSRNVREQRNQAFMQAYQTVPPEDLERLRKVVLLDCQYFQYDDKPLDVFQPTTILSRANGTFNYFDGL